MTGFDAEVLIELGEAVLEEVLPLLPAERISTAIADMDTDDGVYILDSLDDRQRDAVLSPGAGAGPRRGGGGVGLSGG